MRWFLKKVREVQTTPKVPAPHYGTVLLGDLYLSVLRVDLGEGDFRIHVELPNAATCHFEGGEEYIVWGRDGNIVYKGIFNVALHKSAGLTADITLHLTLEGHHSNSWRNSKYALNE